MAGTLYLVGTPIGNLGDLAPRAVEALGAADVVCCEDTRRTGRLLQHAGVRARSLPATGALSRPKRRWPSATRWRVTSRVAAWLSKPMVGCRPIGSMPQVST